jgi:hypothetical protein
LFTVNWFTNFSKTKKLVANQLTPTVNKRKKRKVKNEPDHGSMENKINKRSSDVREIILDPTVVE